jgi:predicted transcriptional regulator
MKKVSKNAAKSHLSLRVDGGIKDSLQKLAEREDRSISFLVQKAINNYIDEQTFLKKEVEKAYAQSKKETHFVSGGQMFEWVDSWGDKKEKSFPKAKYKFR